MEISIKSYNVTEQKINVELIPQLISYWKLRRYCSPYNTQFVRVIRQQRAYNLMTLTNNYGDWSIKYNHLDLNNSLLFTDSNLNLRGNECAHLNEGLTDLLFAGKGAHVTGCVEVTRITQDEFNGAITEATERDYGRLPFWVNMDIVLSNSGIEKFGQHSTSFRVLDLVVSPEDYESGLGLVTELTPTKTHDSSYFKPQTPQLRWYE